MSQLPRFAILGRPNVGKSTLFNRISGHRRALVGNEPGMTRDRLYARSEWEGKPFEIIDTGGMVPAEREVMAREIYRQAGMAIQQAARLVLVVDGRAGIVPLDEDLARLLRLTGKPLTLAVNKIDSAQQLPLIADFHPLGIAAMFPVSAEHGFGVDELLDHLTADLPSSGTVAAQMRPYSPRPRRSAAGRTTMAPLPAPESRTAPEQGRVANARSDPEAGRATSDGEDEGVTTERLAATSPESAIRVAIIGRPNVGKSTLLNALLREERSIITPLPGTTRDAVDAELQDAGAWFRIIDTAGIRRKGKTKLLAEKLSVIQARKHLERSDVALVVLDATEGVTALDTHIAGYAHESRRSVVLVINKWDALKKGPNVVRDFTQTVRRRMKYLDYAPLLFISAQKRQGLEKLLRVVVEVAKARRRRIGTAEMNRFVSEVDFERAPLPAHKPLRVYYLTQAGVAPPTFIAFTNKGGKLHFSVERFLENRIRERFGFSGTPIIIKSRASR